MLVVDLEGYEPMDLRFDDQELVLTLLRIILAYMDGPFEVRPYRADEHNAMRQLLEE